MRINGFNVKGRHREKRGEALFVNVYSPVEFYILFGWSATQTIGARIHEIHPSNTNPFSAPTIAYDSSEHKSQFRVYEGSAGDLML